MPCISHKPHSTTQGTNPCYTSLSPAFGSLPTMLNLITTTTTAVLLPLLLLFTSLARAACVPDPYFTEYGPQTSTMTITRNYAASDTQRERERFRRIDRGRSRAMGNILLLNPPPSLSPCRVYSPFAQCLFGRYEQHSRSTSRSLRQVSLIRHLGLSHFGTDEVALSSLKVARRCDHSVPSIADTFVLVVSLNTFDCSYQHA